MSDLKAMRAGAEARLRDSVPILYSLNPVTALALIACAEALGPMIDRWEPDGDADRRMWDRAVAARAQLEAAP